jgi:CRP-like cAMP-binding protein
MSLEGLFPIDRWSSKSQFILKNLPVEEFEILSAHMTRQKYKKGDVVFREGAVPSGIFYLEQGKLKKYKVDIEGKEQIIYVSNSGDLIGYHAVIANERFPDSAAAIEESIVAFIPKEDFLEAIDKSRILSQRLLRALSHEFAVLSNSISVFAQRSVRERLAIALIVLRERFKKDNSQNKEIVIDISRKDLSNIVGTANENVVRVLKEFKIADILQTQGRKIFIKDINKLIEISGYGLVSKQRSLIKRT